ncbi:protein-methionine-sulfoxide reductase heme-binding subunit MsrQ [Paraglaciecola hydrolytica]|uniref:Protein-methionine-sulfoxide reductase heme-binding subunit MsrQ n=1 Tax=Paraglaciecola hydrolytica TaxID=1799789 RepID=A0A136A1B2_9ALTE|nr:protein-methionine-sulfoxide reductase heme-binding subunit MsrQ [Paraglaciecola hydrolytica]KXI29022.1 sulfoxide reductase heme-binding subunit YedZ [Paraglaciecola hydrolytica]
MAFRLNHKYIIALKVVIHLAAFIPLLYTFYLASIDQLSADPVKALLHFTGISAFNLLLLSLLVSPLAKQLRQALLINVRRLLGLYAFAYALCHFLVYIFFELQLNWTLLLSEIIKRPYITVGFAALLILTALALTSTKTIQRKLKTKWQKLHNWVYLAVLLVALHFIWSVKSDITEPLIYWAMSLILLSQRKDKLKQWWQKRKRQGQASKSTS